MTCCDRFSLAFAGYFLHCGMLLFALVGRNAHGSCIQRCSRVHLTLFFLWNDRDYSDQFIAEWVWELNNLFATEEFEGIMKDLRCFFFCYYKKYQYCKLATPFKWLRCVQERVSDMMDTHLCVQDWWTYEVIWFVRMTSKSGKKEAASFGFWTILITVLWRYIQRNKHTIQENNVCFEKRPIVFWKWRRKEKGIIKAKDGLSLKHICTCHSVHPRTKEEGEILRLNEKADVYTRTKPDLLITNHILNNISYSF